jgi:hypothetical protein
MYRLAALIVLPILSLIATAAPVTGQAGWPGVFPAVEGYTRIFEKPVVTGKDPTKPSYSQAACYSFNGNSIRIIRLTLVHAEAKMSEGPWPGMDRDRLGKRFVWTSKGKKEALPTVKVIIPLGGVSGIILDGEGAVTKQTLINLAKKLDLERIAAVLKNPPHTAAARTVEAFRAITKRMTYADLTAYVGEPDADIGSGTHVMEYKLSDGGRILVGTPDLKKIAYIKHQTRIGKTTDLLK